jgi:hypothetical protein
VQSSVPALAQARHDHGAQSRRTPGLTRIAGSGYSFASSCQEVRLEDNVACVTCDTLLVGHHCHVCGEKRADERELTLAGFARYALDAATNVDARLYVSLRRLVARPGLLTREFVAGRRRPYLGPLQLFLLSNLVFFLLLQLGWGTSVFTTDLVYHRTQPVYGGTADRLVAERVGAFERPSPGAPFAARLELLTEEQADFRERFNAAQPRYANSLVILMVPLFALLLRLLRRQSLFVRELVFSLHFFAFLLLFLKTIPLPVLLLLPIWRQGAAFLNEHDIWVGLLLVGGILWYLASGFRTAHGDPRSRALARALVALPLLLLVVTIYRGVLFFVVYFAAM